MRAWAQADPRGGDGRAPRSERPAAARLLELEVDDAHEAVGIGLEAGELLRIAVNPLAVIEIDDRQIALRDRIDLVIELLARGGIARLARLVQQLVDLGVAVAPVIEVPLAGEEGIEVAVRIDAAAPADLIGFEVALLLAIEGGREFDGLDLDGDAGLLRHRLDDLGHLLVVARRRHHQLDRRIAVPRLLEELLGLGDVGAGYGEILVEPRAHRRERLIARKVLAIIDRLHERLAIDRQGERLADARILAEDRRRAGAVADVGGDADIADLGNRRDFEIRIVAHGGDVARLQALHEIEAAGLQVGDAHGRVHDGAILDAIDEDVALVPILVELLDGDVVLGHALDEFVGAGANGMSREVLALRLGRLGRQHHAGAVGQCREQRRERRGEIELDRLVVNHLDALDGADLAFAVRAFEVEVALDVELDRLGVERGAVLEEHALAQLD